jgi:hypothetical protein
MFKIEYQTDGGVIGWLHTEYPDPDDADNIAKRLVQGLVGISFARQWWSRLVMFTLSG